MLCFRLERTNEASPTLARWMLRRRAVRECSRASADPQPLCPPLDCRPEFLKFKGATDRRFLAKLTMSYQTSNSAHI